MPTSWEERRKGNMTSSLTICAQLHKATQVLTHKSHLPPIEELRKTITMEHLLEKIQQNINQRWERVEATTK
jgi:hypothetical protein